MSEQKKENIAVLGGVASRKRFEMVIANLGDKTLDYEKMDMSRMPKYGTVFAPYFSDIDFTLIGWLVKIGDHEKDFIMEFCKEHDNDKYRTSNPEIPKFYIPKDEILFFEVGDTVKFTSYSEMEVGQTAHYTQYFRRW